MLIFTNLIQDARYAVRMLAKHKSFTAVTVISLALGIGANSTIFSIANALLLKPFPFENLERLVLVQERFPNQDFKATGVSPADFIDWRSQSDSFQELAAFRVRDVTITGTGEPEAVGGAVVTENFFRAIGLNMVAGRSFSPTETQPDEDQVAILSDGLWQKNFAGDPGILGQSIHLNGRKVTIIGVMPSNFDFPFGTQVWMPLALNQQQVAVRDVRNLQVLGRLKTEVSVARAQAEMVGISKIIEQQYPQTNARLTVNVVPVRDQQAGFTRPLVSVLFAMAGFLLLIACANVANLLLARGAATRKELVIRATLGAGRWRIIQQLLTESLLIALVAGAFSLLLSLWAVYMVKASLPPDIARFMAGWKEIRVDGRMLAFTFALGLLTTLVFSLLPSLRISKLDLNQALKELGRSSVTNARGRLRELLVVSELVLALVLLVGAGLMVRGFWNTLKSFKGSDPETILTLRTSLPESKYNDKKKVEAFYRDVLGRIEALPEVLSAGITSNTPLNNRPNPSVDFNIEGKPPLLPGEKQSSNLLVVSPNYFKTIGVPLLQGRDFSASDAGEAPAVAIISELMARRYWPQSDHLGARIKFSNLAAGQWVTVIGVVRDVKESWFDQEMRPNVYLSYLQTPQPSMHIMMATRVDPMSLASIARTQVYSVDHDQLVNDTRTLGRIFAAEGSPFTFAAVLMFAFGAIALALSAIGVYSMMSYTVAQRRREIGLRVALGAQRGDVLRLVVGQGMLIAAFGLMVGLPAAYVLSRVMASVLFGIVTLEYAVLLTFVAVLALVAFLSSYIPARRAAEVDPLEALRYE